MSSYTFQCFLTLIAEESFPNCVVHTGSCSIPYYSLALLRFVVKVIIVEYYFIDCCIIQSHGGPVWKVVWAHPEFGQILATCSFDRSVIIWEETGEFRKYITWAHLPSVHSGGNKYHNATS